MQDVLAPDHGNNIRRLVLRALLVALLVAVTVACCTKAPVESVTVPLIDAVCPTAAGASQSNSRRAAIKETRT